MAGMVKPSIKKSTGLREDMPLRGVFTVENQMLQLFDFGRKPFSLKWPHERTSSKKSFKRKGAKEKVQKKRPRFWGYLISVVSSF
jgi:hypothetical protein